MGRLILTVTSLIILFGASCSLKKEDEPGPVNPVEIPASSLEYVVFGWSEHAMHAMSATYDGAVIAVPYVTIRAQVVRRGNPPEIVTSGIRLEYNTVNNTYSYGKRSYAQFWDNSEQLFGTVLAPDTGLNFVDPGVHNGLTGSMLLKGNIFQADGIPLTPVDDTDTWSPYQQVEIVVYEDPNSIELARTKIVTGVSDEMNCAKCHGQGEVPSVLEAHDAAEGTTLASGGPVLCASCHGSSALGQNDAGSSGRYLSEAVHAFHAMNQTASAASCTDCHPGANTTLNRSTAHTATDGNCQDCHGTMGTLAATVTSGGRIPWLSEPSCISCHTFVAGVDIGTNLYSAAAGHGGLACASCHGTGHAQIPTSETGDEYQSVQYQNKAVTIGSCRVCHATSKGGGLNNFMAAHGSGEKTACYVCHTAPPPSNNPAAWPHKFQGRNRD